MKPATPTPRFRAIVCLLALPALLAASGCLQTTAVSPRPVRFEEENKEFEDKFAELKNAYDDAISADTRSAKARVARDRMIFLLRVEIDKWYAQLEQDLYETRAGFNSWADFLELGMAGAGTIAAPVHTKTVWTTLLSATKGTRLSIDKNWFREKATESLMNAMRTGRSLQLAQIVKKMSANTAQRYTFEEAWGDLIAYHQAGTIQGGLVLLAATTGEQAKEAEQKVDKANQPRYAEVRKDLTAADATEIAELRGILQKMNLEQRRKTIEDIDKKAPADDATEEAINDLIQEKLDQLILTIPAEDRLNINRAIRANAPKP